MRDLQVEDDYRKVAEETLSVFSIGDLPETLRLLDQYFGGLQYSLKSLFKDEQKRILDILLGHTLRDVELHYREIYQRNGPILHFMKDMNQPVPEVLRITAEFVLNSDLRRTLDADPPDTLRLAMLMELVKREGVRLDDTGLAYAASNSLNRLMRRLRQDPHSAELLNRIVVLVTVLQMFPFTMDYWEAQNIYYSILRDIYPNPEFAGSTKRAWREKFLALGEKLQVSTPVREIRPELQLAS